MIFGGTRNEYILIHANDSVALVLKPLAASSTITVNGHDTLLKEDI